MKAVCLCPLGGQSFRLQGTGLAEVLAGTVTGMRLGTEQSGIVLGDTKVGHFMMAIDPSSFGGEALFDERIGAYLDGYRYSLQTRSAARSICKSSRAETPHPSRAPRDCPWGRER